MRLWFCTKIELDYLNALAYSQKLFTMIVYFMNMVIREQCQAQTCLNKITALSTYIIDANTEFRSKYLQIKKEVTWANSIPSSASTKHELFKKSSRYFSEV